MRSLESETNPFRTRPEFYRPKNLRKPFYTRKNFPAQHSDRNPILIDNCTESKPLTERLPQCARKGTISYTG